MDYFIRIWIACLLSISTAFGHPLKTLIGPHFGFNQVATQDTCANFSLRRDSVLCNPANIAISNTEDLTFSIFSKTDGDSVEAGQKILFDPIKEDNLRDLFELNSFNSWEANTMIEFHTGYFYLSYEPIYAQAGFFIYNPASPEISLTSSSQRRINITIGDQYEISSNHSLSFGTNVFYYERNYYSGQFSLLDLTGTDVDELVSFKKTSAINTDLGLLYQNDETLWIPYVSWQYRNLGSSHEVDEDKLDDEVSLESILLYEPYMKFEIGYDFLLEYGSLGISSSFSFDKEMKTYYSDYSVLALNYSLWNFEVMSSFSLYTKTLGIKFASNSNSVGVIWGETKALGDYLDRPESFAIVALEIYL